MNTLRLVLIAVAVLIAGLIGWRYKGAAPGGRPQPIETMGRPAAPMANDEARHAVTEQLSQIAEYTPFYARFAQVFPVDQTDIVQNFVAKTTTSGAADSPDAYIIEALRALQSRRGIVAAKAISEKLARIFEAQSAIMAALANNNPSLCREFLYGGSSDGFLDFAASHRPLIADMAMAGLDAIEDGKTSAIEREPPADSDLDNLAQALAGRGLSPPEIAALMDGAMPSEVISDARMCEIGQIHLETLRTLPEPARSRVLALAVKLMAHS
jgi:hypothetical protein